MTAKIELIPLRCTRCETPVPAENDEVAWVCTQCSQGLLLDEREGLQNLEVHYTSDLGPNMIGKPYWVVEGQVNLDREAKDGWFDQSEDHSDRLWEEKQRFFIPAFNTSLDELLELSTSMFSNPPELLEGPAADFEAVILSPRDLTSVIEFIILTVEAGRKDDIKSIGVTVELDTPVLWVLP